MGGGVAGSYSCGGSDGQEINRGLIAVAFSTPGYQQVEWVKQRGGNGDRVWNDFESESFN